MPKKQALDSTYYAAKLKVPEDYTKEILAFMAGLSAGMSDNSSKKALTYYIDLLRSVYTELDRIRTELIGQN